MPSTKTYSIPAKIVNAGDLLEYFTL